MSIGRWLRSRSRQAGRRGCSARRMPSQPLLEPSGQSVEMSPNMRRVAYGHAFVTLCVGMVAVCRRRWRWECAGCGRSYTDGCRQNLTMFGAFRRAFRESSETKGRRIVFFVQQVRRAAGLLPVVCEPFTSCRPACFAQFLAGAARRPPRRRAVRDAAPSAGLPAGHLPAGHWPPPARCSSAVRAAGFELACSWCSCPEFTCGA